MFSDIHEQLLGKGYAIAIGCIEESAIFEIQKSINLNLINHLTYNKKKYYKTFKENFYACKNLISQHEIQVFLSKKLLIEDLIEKIIFNNKVNDILSFLLGPDLEYLSDFEMAINDKNEVKNDYLFKKYHQEFWSGMGVEALQLWIPIFLEKGMGTIEVIEESHTWGHIPHRNREPIEIPKNHNSNVLDIKLGSLAIFTSFTLHRTVLNNFDSPRVALPITVRNPYYPNTGNMDLFNFRKIKMSYFSRLRKMLGNNQYSSFRTLGQNRKDFYKK